METIKSYALMIDSKTWVIIGIVLAVLFVISLVKKIVHLACLFALMACLSFGASYVNTHVLEENGVQFKDGQVYVMDSHFELKDVRDIKIKKINETDAKMIITLKNGSTSEISIPVEKINIFKNIGKIMGFDTPVSDQV